ncbi:MAG TPA: DUF3344 domain-containing protein, partial [Methanosarcinales archaeon]|nr:DUF3344 domain-containing protein [Methanosarcinales archaeon]
VANSEDGSNFDLKSFDVSNYLLPSGNKVKFSRGEETSVHPVNAVLVVSKEQTQPTQTPTQTPTPTPTPTQTYSRIDLAIANATIPKIFRDTTATISVLVHNLGEWDSGGFDVALYVDNQVVDTKSISGLKSGEGKQITFTWTPDEVKQYTLIVEIDPDNEISESDKTNNKYQLIVEVKDKNGYFGDKPLETYRHETIKGDIIYDIGNSSYQLLDPEDTYAIGHNITVPENANIKLARLYLYWTWSYSGSEGVYPELELEFENKILQIDRSYTDRKGFGTFDYPSGTYAYNITNYVKDTLGNKTGNTTYNYTTLVKNIAKDKYLAINGIGLLLAYQNPDKSEIEYWINEGCDILQADHGQYNFGVTPELATTEIIFNGSIDLGSAGKAKLITVVPSGDKGENELYFNSENWNKVYIGKPYKDLAIDERDVSDYLLPNKNIAKIRDTGDYMIPSMAILIIEHHLQTPYIGETDIINGKLSDTGINYVPDNLYGSAYGILRFGIYDMIHRIIGFRNAVDITIYAVNNTVDVSDWDWNNVTETNKKRTVHLFIDLYTNETQEYTTIISFYDENDNGIQ